MSNKHLTEYRYEKLTWPEINDALAAKQICIVPCGAVEQHGPHLPLGANVLIAERVAHRVSQTLGILRAPTFSYGVSYSRDPYAGVAGLRRKTLHRAINELMAQWEDHGVTQFIVITAHRFEPHLEALLMAMTDTATNSVYDLYQIGTADVLDTDPELEHGGEMETSLLLHLAPDLVRLSEAVDYMPDAKALRRYTRGRVPTPQNESRGVVGRPSLGTAEKGRRLFERFVDTLIDDIGRG